MSLRTGAQLLPREDNRSPVGPFSRTTVGGVAVESLVKGEYQQTV